MPPCVFKHAPQPSSFSVPPSEPYVSRCWSDPKASFHMPRDCQDLTAIKGASQYGLDRMPVVDASISFLIVSPDEAVRLDVRCLRPQCRINDDLLTRGYNIANRMERISNLPPGFGPLTDSPDFHQTHCGSTFISARQRHSHSPLFGLLAQMYCDSRAGCSQCIKSLEPRDLAGSYCEFQKQLIDSQSAGHSYWDNPLLGDDEGLSLTTKG